MSKLEEKFSAAWNEYGLPFAPECQYHIDGRRFDFAWPDFKVAVEVNGFGWGHSTVSKKAADAQKMREAIKLGWVVLPFTSACISSKAKLEDACHDVVCVMGNQSDVLIELQKGCSNE